MSGSPWSVATATVSSPKRGPGTQPDTPAFAIQSLSFTWSWGSQPAQGSLTYVAADDFPPITYGAWLELTVYGKTFYGICQRGAILVPQDDGTILGAPTERSSGGRTLRLEFLDPRRYLRWDKVFCAFNMLDIRMLDGLRVRRYKHLFPENYGRWIWSYTTKPVSAAFILRKVLAFSRSRTPLGTVGTDWVISSIWPNGAYQPGGYHPDQENYPVYNVDCLGGKFLDELLQEIADAQGLLFTLQAGPYNLVFCRKGDGIIPSFPERSDYQEVSQALSENPTRLYVVGDRNRYLCLDLTLQPDWNRNWESLITVDGLMQWLYDNASDPITGHRYNAIPGDTEHASGYQLAAARAREITVREFAALRGGDWEDYRFFGGRSRMDMPAALYLDTILFRAFRPPAVVNIKGEAVPTGVLTLVDDLFARVYLEDLRNPKMTVDQTNPPGGNGFAIARGFNVGAEIFKAINPERFNLADFDNIADIWQPVTFQIDDSFETGRYLIMDEKMINLEGLFVGQSVEDMQDPALAEINGYLVLRADAPITAPEVRAALCFEGDKFVYRYSTGDTDPRNGSRDDSINESGLYQEVVQALNGSWFEMPYADGKSAEVKAVELASVLCRRPFWYYQGSYNWKLLPGDVIPDLNGMINRITLEYGAGHTCQVEFANGRPEPVYRQEREYDRRRRWQSVLPGQQELRDQARLLRELSAAFRQTPQMVIKLNEFLRGRMGQISQGQIEPCVINEGTGTLPVGTPLWKRSAATAELDPGTGRQARGKEHTTAVMPSAVSTEHDVFVGVTTRHNENAAAKIWLQNTGTMLARVQGPVSVGDTVVRAEGADYLVGQTSGADGAPVVGTAREDLTTQEIKLIRVVSPAGGGGGGEQGPALWA